MAYKDMVSPENMEKAIWQAILAIRGQAVALAPTDTGALRNSVMVATEKREYGFNRAQGEAAPDSAKIEKPTEDMVGYVGTGMEYGAAVEYGRPDMPNYPAQPYLRPAAAYYRGRVAGIMAKDLAQSIKDMSAKNYPFRK